MALLPKTVCNSFRTCTVMVLNLPIFLALFALVFLFSLPSWLWNILKALLCIKRFQVGSGFFNPMFVTIEIVYTIFLARNPLCPKGVMANQGRWLHFVLALLAFSIGKCFACCRERKKSSDGALPMDGNVEVINVDDHVTIVHSQHIDTVDTICCMTVIKYDDYVIFITPVQAPIETYRNLRGDAKRVILFMSTMFHNVAAGSCMQAFPGVEVWGCDSVEGRTAFLKRGDVKQPGSLKGMQFFNLPGTTYNEWYIYFEPSKLLVMGDFAPQGLEKAIGSKLSVDLINFVHTCDPCTQLSYSRSLVSDLAGTAKVIKHVLALDLDRLEGAHPHDSSMSESSNKGTKRINAKNELFDYWSWLLPKQMGPQEPLV